MPILFFDTETSDMILYRERDDHPSQPHIVQLAAMLTTDDGQPVVELSTLIYPDGWSIGEGAEGVHGISKLQCEDFGMPLATALDALFSMVQCAKVVVAHNIDFDKRMVEIESLRLGVNHEIEHRLPDRELFCTMKATTPICKLPGRYDDFKWPKLTEAYRHFFKQDFEGAHDAMGDVRACAKVYFEIKKLQLQGAQS